VFLYLYHMTRSEIQQIQTALNAALPDLPRLAPDGLIGAKSKAALMAWETRRGLAPVADFERAYGVMFPAQEKPFPRNIKYLVLHCAATQPDATIESIQRYWRVNLGWKAPGYHWLISADGVAHALQPIEKSSNGVAGYNSTSIHISYIGGIDRNGKPKDTRTEAQKVTQLRLLRELRVKFPKARILGHRDFPSVSKACPSFDVKSWVEANGIKANP